MTGLSDFTNHPLVIALGWTLLHSIWQGALIAAGYALAKQVTRHESAQVKYTLASSALLLMILVPAVTFGAQSSGWFTGATSSGKIPIQEELFDTTELDLAAQKLPGPVVLATLAETTAAATPAPTRLQRL